MGKRPRRAKRDKKRRNQAKTTVGATTTILALAAFVQELDKFLH